MSRALCHETFGKKTPAAILVFRRFKMIMWLEFFLLCHLESSGCGDKTMERCDLERKKKKKKWMFPMVYSQDINMS